jgi:hypothetical protein
VTDPLLDFRSDPLVSRECQQVGVADLKVRPMSIDLDDILPTHFAVTAAPADHADTPTGGMSEFGSDPTS